MATALPAPASLAAAAGLVAGFAAARATGRRAAGGAVFAVAAAWCARSWHRDVGRLGAAGLTFLYTAAMGGSHPLAKKVGGWPSVLLVAAGTAAVAEAAGRLAAGR